jgi:hypothetical protein
MQEVMTATIMIRDSDLPLLGLSLINAHNRVETSDIMFQPVVGAGLDRATRVLW